MRWLLLVAALFAACSASPVLLDANDAPLRTRTAAVGGHLRLPSRTAPEVDTMLLSGAGDGAEQAVANNTDDDDDEDRKTLAQQIADGKYGLLQNEIYTSAPERPGVISYDPNPEVPRDTAKNLGGLEQDEIWLAEDHVLVLRGGRYPDHKPNRTKPTDIWPPIDNYKAPPRQVKIPSNPKVPPPFPVQLTDGGPTELLGPNGSKPIILPPGNGSYFAPPFPFPPPPPGNFTPENGPFYPPPPYYGYPPPGPLPSPTPPFQPSKNQSLYGQPPYPLSPPGNFTPGNGPPPFYPFPFPPPLNNGSFYPPPPGFFPLPPRNGSFLPPPGFPPPPFGNGTLPPGLFPPPGYFPPGAAFLPPPGSLNDTYDEDDPSIYYPPPYDFFYPKDNTTQVPPGPLVPGIILPPPPNFFAPLNVTNGKTRTTTPAPSTSTEQPATTIPSPPTPYPPRRKKPFRPSPSFDDTISSNQVTTEKPTQFYSKPVKGIIFSTPSPVTYVVVPVTDINVSPPSPNKQSPFLVYKTSSPLAPRRNNNRIPQNQGRGGISTTVPPNPRGPKTSYYFYEEPHVSQGHLSEAGVLKTPKGYYSNGYYYDPPEITTSHPQIYYNLPPTTPAPQVYYIPSKSSKGETLSYYSIPAKSPSPELPLYYKKPQLSSNLYYNNVPTPAPPLYYYVNNRPQQQQGQQYYSALSPHYQEVQQPKSNLQYYNSQDIPFIPSRQIYQVNYDAGGPSTANPRPWTASSQFASSPRATSTPRTVYEYSFEKQSSLGVSNTTPLSPVSQYTGATARPHYDTPTSSPERPEYIQQARNPYAVSKERPQNVESSASPYGVSTERPQFVQPSVSPFVVYTERPQYIQSPVVPIERPQYLQPAASPHGVSTERPQYLQPSANPYRVSTKRPQYAQPSSNPYVVSTERPQYAQPSANPYVVSTERPNHIQPSASPFATSTERTRYVGSGQQYKGSTPNPQHAYYTPQDERLFDDITKKYFTIFGQKLGGGTTPMTPIREQYISTTTPQPISLEGDTAVNYRPPLPPIEPESEPIDAGRNPGVSDGELISYRLPGNDAHFFFLTPQARQRYRRRKPPR